MKVAVVGRGLIGSAAARHLAKAGQQVVLIGPDEVTGDWSAHGNSFASHYDEGRITRKNDRRAFFARASAAAIARYAEIAADSGIDFFTETGALLAGSPAFMARVAEARQDVDVSFEALDAEMLADRFPFFAVPDGFSGDFEATEAGHISARRLVAAQTKAALRYGAKIVPEEATSVEEGRVITATTTVEADEVIVAAGGWTDALLGRAELDVYARTVALHEIGPDEAKRLATMPALVMESPDDVYILPPVLYPDGKLWLKAGRRPGRRQTAGEISDQRLVSGWRQQRNRPLSDRAHLRNHSRPCLSIATSSRLCNHMEPRWYPRDTPSCAAPDCCRCGKRRRCKMQ